MRNFESIKPGAAYGAAPGFWFERKIVRPLGFPLTGEGGMRSVTDEGVALGLHYFSGLFVHFGYALRSSVRLSR